MSLRYLLDENLPPSWRSRLLRRDPTLIVRRVGDPAAPPLGTLDPVILEWCEKNDFLLVTNNRRSMPRHLADHLAAGHHVPGIFLVSSMLKARQLLDDLVLMAGASLADEYQDQIRHLPIT